MKQFQKFGYVMSANVESIAAMIAAHYAGGWLNTKYPQGFDWVMVTYVLGLLLVIRSWYVVIRLMIREQNSNKDEPAP